MKASSASARGTRRLAMRAESVACSWRRSSEKPGILRAPSKARKTSTESTRFFSMRVPRKVTACWMLVILRTTPK